MLGWTCQTIDALVCGDDVVEGRPAPDLILLAMKLMAWTIRHVSQTSATRRSISSPPPAQDVRWNIGVLSGAHTRAALERAPHTHIIQSVS